MEIALALEVLAVVAAPLALAVWLRKRWPSLSWATFGAGALAFVGSQLLHLPFNAYVLEWLVSPLSALPERAQLWVSAALLGLSAGLFEELARYAAYRAHAPARRSGADALMLGAGHGGTESILLGLFVLLGLMNVLVVERVGIEHLGLDAERQALARQGLDELRAVPLYAPLLATLERLFTIVFHVSASALVGLAVARRSVVLLAVAVAWHAIYDGITVVVLHDHGAVAAELWLALTVPMSAGIIALSLRALPRLEREPVDPRPPAVGAPIELVRAEKRFGEVKALGGVTLTIPAGARACLLGPNGAGKTTAIRLVTGALQPTRGHAFLFGSASDDPRFVDAKRRVGIVPQQPGMYAELTVRGYLDFVRALYGADDDPALLQRLGLADVMDRRTNELSGGMQRRLSLAAALVGKPELLILDEPSAGLDPVAAREMVELLAEVGKGRTTLLCTHDLDEAEELCDTVVILHEGTVLVNEPIAALKARAEARLVLRAVGGPEALRAALEERGKSPTGEGDELDIPWVGGDESLPALLRELLAGGVDVCECRLVRPTLENLFLQLVREARARTDEASP